MRRIMAARCVRDNPEVYLKLRDGRLSLCAVAELSKVINQDNKQELFTATEGRSKLEVQRVVAAILPPVAPKREQIKVVRTKALPAEPLSLFTATAKAPVPEVKEQYSITLQVDRDFIELYNRAQVICGPKPMSKILERSLKQFIGLHEPGQRRARRLTRRKGKVSRHIPVAVRDEVFARDGHCCTFVSADGHRCQETRGLEIDHIKPFALGGASDELSNLRLRCGTHNRLEAERIFGVTKMQSHYKTFFS